MIHHENIIIMFITGGEKSSLNQDSNPGLELRTQTQDSNSGPRTQPRTQTQLHRMNTPIYMYTDYRL